MWPILLVILSYLLYLYHWRCRIKAMVAELDEAKRKREDAAIQRASVARIKAAHALAAGIQAHYDPYSEPTDCLPSYLSDCLADESNRSIKTMPSAAIPDVVPRPLDYSSPQWYIHHRGL